MEVLTGAPRRRRWSAAEKAAIVAESQAPGAQTSEIALRYGLHRNQLYDWRREFGTAAVGNAIAETGAPGPDFIPVVVDAGSGSAAIEIEIGSALVRVRAGVDSALLGKVLRLLKLRRTSFVRSVRDTDRLHSRLRCQTRIWFPACD
jgi:transposase